MQPQFSSAVVGGTFDHFHKGHESLLTAVFSQSKRVTIGISTEKLYKQKIYTDFIEEFEKRKKSVEDFLRDHNFTNATIVPIDDIYGPTTEDETFDAIFVTEENKAAADLINEKRKEIGFPELQIILVPFVSADNGRAISSESIRKGIMNRSGFVYASVFQSKSLQLPERLRARLRKPIGFVTQDLQSQKSKLQSAALLISVGDIVTFTLTEAGMLPDVSVLDFKTRRHDLKPEEKALLEKISEPGLVCSNAAGKIETDAAMAIQEALEKKFETGTKQVVRIKGEEDLLTLPAILLSPLGSVVVYGQYDEGAVLVAITEQKKKEILELVNQFE